MNSVSFVCTRLDGFNWYFLLLSCLFQEGQCVIYFDVLEQIVQKIHLEKSDENKSSTFYENVFNGANHLTGQTLWLLFQFQYKRERKHCMTNAPSGYNGLFSFCYSEIWTPFSQIGMDLEEFIVNVIPVSLLFCVKEFFDFGFQVSIRNPEFVGGHV